jgi:hypothetical protein
VETQFLSDRASVADNGDDTAGETAGFFAWVKTNTTMGATGADGGFNTTTKVTDAPTLGTKRVLTETEIRDVAQAVYEEGGMTEYLCGTPQVIRNLSEYLFTSSARVATMQNERQGENRDQSGTAYGSITVFVTDFGQILKMVSNRLHPAAQAASATVPDAAASHLAFIDPRGVRAAFLQGFQTRPLARTGLSEKRLTSVDLCLAVTNE